MTEEIAVAKSIPLPRGTCQRLVELFCMAQGADQAAQAAKQLAEAAAARYNEMATTVRDAHGVAPERKVRFNFLAGALELLEEGGAPTPNGASPPPAGT